MTYATYEGRLQETLYGYDLRVTSDVLARGARGGGVMILGQLGKLVIQVVSVVVLSRLLTPADFGLVAMVAIFLALGDLLRDFGMPTAALQARQLSHQQASNVFWVTTGLGVVAAAAIIIATPGIVELYDDPRLGSVAPAMALAVFVNGAQAQLQVQLARAGRYRSLALSDVAAQATGLAVAVTAALLGWGYWALVGQVLTAALALLAGRALIARWRPSRPRRGHGSSAIFRAGGQFGSAQFLAFAANNADTLLIGARWGPVSLGFYNRAFQLYTLPRTALLDPLTQVVVPTLNAGEAGKGASAALLRIQFALGLPIVWVYLLLAATSEWTVPIVLGSQWSSSSPILVALAVGGWFLSFGSVSFWSFVVAHQSGQLLLLHLVTKPLTILMIVLAVPQGPLAVAWTYAAAIAVSWPINLIWLAKTTGQDSIKFFIHGCRLLSAAGVSLILTKAISERLQFAVPILNSLAFAAISSAIYFACISITSKGRAELAQVPKFVLQALRERSR